MQNVPFIVSLSTAPVLHWKPASLTGNPFDSYHGHRHSKNHTRCTYTKTNTNHVSYAYNLFIHFLYRGADKSLARPGRKWARNHVRDERDFNNIETRSVINFFFFLQGKAPKEIHAIVTETLACFLPGRPKDLSAPLYLKNQCSLSLRPVRIIVKSAY